MRRSSKSRPKQRRPLHLESLEGRDLLAIYLPTSFASAAAQPVGMAHNGGEQLFFAGYNDELQFGFGDSIQASNYAGSGWNQAEMDDLPQIGTLPDIVGRPAVVVNPFGVQQIVYNNGTDLTIVDETDWEPRTIGPSGVDSNPVSVSMHGGQQIFHVNDTPQSHVVMAWSTTGFQSHGYVDLNMLFGVGSLSGDTPADAIPYGGIAAFETGTEEHVVYQRFDGDLGVMTFASGGPNYQVLSASTLPGFVPPAADSSGELSYTSYDSTGNGGTHNVGWIAYKDVNDELRLIWKVAGQPWRTAKVTDTFLGSVPTLAYDEVARKVSIAFICDCGHVRLLQESSTGWTETDFQGGELLTIPLPGAGIPDAVSGTQASGTISLSNTSTSFTLTAVANTLADGSSGNFVDLILLRAADAAVATGILSLTSGALSVSAEENSSIDGVAGNGIDIVLQSGASTGVVGFAAGVLTVDVAAGATVNDVRAAIDADARFAASTVSGGAVVHDPGDLTTHTDVTAGGSNGSTIAYFDAFSLEIIVDVAIGETGSGLATEIGSLTEFNVSSVVNGSSTFNPADYGTISNPLTGGTDTVLPGSPARPDIYWRGHASGHVAAGLHIVYVDEAGHLQNFRPAGQGETPSGLGTLNSPILDTTAYMEGYRKLSGYGIVNAARALAYALNTTTPSSGAASVTPELDLIKVPDAWTTATGLNTAVFTLDSGVDPTNTDLRVLDAINVTMGFPDDDANGHGTAIAGIIAAADDSDGTIGVAYDSEVISIKVGDSFGESEDALVNGLAAAVFYSLPGGYSDTRIINMSFAYTYDTGYPELVLPMLRDAMYILRDDAVYITAIGNRNKIEPEMPAASAVGFGILAGAVDNSGAMWVPDNDARAAISAVNLLLAPGYQVESPTLVGSSGDDHNTAARSGTGIAAAHISGIAALLLEVNPALTPREVESILIASADPLGHENYRLDTATTLYATINWV